LRIAPAGALCLVVVSRRRGPKSQGARLGVATLRTTLIRDVAGLVPGDGEDKTLTPLQALGLLLVPDLGLSPGLVRGPADSWQTQLLAPVAEASDPTAWGGAGVMWLAIRSGRSGAEVDALRALAGAVADGRVRSFHDGLKLRRDWWRRGGVWKHRLAVLEDNVTVMREGAAGRYGPNGRPLPLVVAGSFAFAALDVARLVVKRDPVGLMAGEARALLWLQRAVPAGEKLKYADLVALLRLLGHSARQAESIATALESGRKVGGSRRKKPPPAA